MPKRHPHNGSWGPRFIFCVFHTPIPASQMFVYSNGTTSKKDDLSKRPSNERYGVQWPSVESEKKLNGKLFSLRIIAENKDRVYSVKKSKAFESLRLTLVSKLFPQSSQSHDFVEAN